MRSLLIVFIFITGSKAIASPPNVSPAQAITLILDTIGPTCGKNNGIISITAIGGVAPFTYSVTGYVTQNFGFFRHAGPGTYTVLVTDNIGQTATETFTFVNRFTAPVASASFTASTGCTSFGASITITGSGGQQPYLYSIDQVYYQANNFFPNLTAGSYRYVVKDANGCESYNSIFNNLDIPTQCPIHHNGITLTYTCDPFLTYLGLNNVSGGTPPYLYSLDGVNYQPNSHYNNGVPAGLYTFWVKDAVGSIMLFTVAVNDKCQPNFKVDAVVQHARCIANGSITVNASMGKPPYEYSLNGGPYQPGNQFSGLAPGGYTVRVRDSVNLTSSVYVEVLNECLTVTANTTNSTCGNNNGEIIIQAVNGIPPYMYSINTLNFIPTNTFTGLPPGSYTVMARDATGAVGYTTATITAQNGPSVNTVNVTPSDCNAHSGSIELICQGGTPPLLYSIDGVSFLPNPIFSALAPGTYTLQVKDGANCMATVSTVVGVNNTLVVDAGTVLPFCEGTGVPLNATTNATSFTWMPTLGLSNPATLNPVASPSISTMYYLTGRTGDCSKTDSVYVQVRQAPVANAGINQTICFGQNASLHGNGGISCTWDPPTYLSNPNAFNPTVIKPVNSVTYKLTVTDANGCSSIGNNVVTVTVTPPARLFAGNDTAIAINQPLQLDAKDVNGSGFVQFTWSPTTGLNNPFIQSPTAILNTNATYTIIGRTVAGCEGIDTINIKVFKQPDIIVPNAFSPNKDGRNDLLKSIPVGIKTFKDFTIYDRYGTIVFHSTDPANGWDGMIKNRAYNSGTFVWIARGIDFNNKEVIRKGSVLVIR